MPPLLMPLLTGLGAAGVGFQAMDFLDRWGNASVEDLISKALDHAGRVNEEAQVYGLQREGERFAEMASGSRDFLASMAGLQKYQEIDEVAWAAEKQRQLQALSVRSVPGPLEMLAAINGRM